MNTTSQRARCAAALFAAHAALALCAPNAQACSTSNPPRLVWPYDGSAEVSPQTHIWFNNVSVEDAPRVFLTQFDSGERVVLIHVETLPAQRSPTGETLDIFAPAQPLRPWTTYALRGAPAYAIDGSGSTRLPTFSTGAEDQPLPEPLDPPSDLRVFRSDARIVYAPGGSDCPTERYNAVRTLRATAREPGYPVLYTLSARATPQASAVVHAIAETPGQRGEFGITAAGIEPDPFDDPCLTLSWIDVFGRRGQLDPICAPNACRTYDSLEFAPSDFSGHNAAECGPIQGGGGCTVLLSPSAPPLPLGLTLAALALLARRPRRTRP